LKSQDRDEQGREQEWDANTNTSGAKSNNSSSSRTDQQADSVGKGKKSKNKADNTAVKDDSKGVGKAGSKRSKGSNRQRHSSLGSIVEEEGGISYIAASPTEILSQQHQHQYQHQYQTANDMRKDPQISSHQDKADVNAMFVSDSESDSDINSDGDKSGHKSSTRRTPSIDRGANAAAAAAAGCILSPPARQRGRPLPFTDHSNMSDFNDYAQSTAAADSDAARNTGGVYLIDSSSSSQTEIDNSSSSFGPYNNGVRHHNRSSAADHDNINSPTSRQQQLQLQHQYQKHPISSMQQISQYTSQSVAATAGPASYGYTTMFGTDLIASASGAVTGANTSLVAGMVPFFDPATSTSDKGRYRLRNPRSVTVIFTVAIIMIIIKIINNK
jgi:hypothetical protein